MANGKWARTANVSQRFEKFDLLIDEQNKKKLLTQLQDVFLLISLE